MSELEKQLNDELSLARKQVGWYRKTLRTVEELVAHVPAANRSFWLREIAETINTPLPKDLE